MGQRLLTRARIPKRYDHCTFEEFLERPDDSSNADALAAAREWVSLWPAVNHGLMCVKGYHLPGFLYGADRLKHPMRKNDDGSWTRVSWDDRPMRITLRA